MVKLEIKLGENIQSFKNKKRSILDSSSGKQRTLTPKKTKQHMDRIEHAIESALFLRCQTSVGVMDSGWQRQLQIVLSGLLDDSLAEIPEFSFGVEYVEKGEEGVVIEIEEIK